MPNQQVRHLILVIVSCVLVFGATGCSLRPGSAASGIILAGSTSVQPFAELLAEDYERRFPSEPIVNVQGGGSTAGIEAALSHTADIGMSSRPLKPKELEAGLAAQPIAYDAIAVVVHPSNPVSELSAAEVRAIFAGEITSWNQVGGEDREIVIVTREEGSGTRGAFEELVMEGQRITPLALRQDSNGAVRVIVSSDPAAIGYISLGIVGEVVKPVALDGVVPTASAAISGEYPLVRPFLFVLNGEPTDDAREFIGFVLSPESQAILGHEGLIPVEDH